MVEYLLGIDVGTYSSKAVLTDLAGKVVQTAVTEHGISMPQPGFVEQDADLIWWSDVCRLSQDIIAKSGAAPSAIAGLAMSAIGPCLLPLDAAMRPLRPGILYGVDTRATAEIAQLEAEIGQSEIFDFSLMELSSQAIGPKIRWLRQHEPEVWRATAKLTSATSYLVYKATGRLCMDRHSASHFMPLYNPATGEWDSRYASSMVSIDQLPELGWAEDLAGTLHTEAASAMGLAVGTPVAFGTIDALSEAISVGATEPGDLMLMHGSTTFFILSQELPTPDPRVWTVAGASPGRFNLAAGMSTTGSLTRWFKDELARDLSADLSRDLSKTHGYAALFAAAAEVPPGSGGLLVLPYFSGERTPINNPHASGVIAGLGLTHTREQMFRAVLEAVGYGVRHNLQTFAQIGAKVKRVLAVGGGTQSDTGLQIVSDITGVPQVLTKVTIGASYGDAFFAGRAAGLLEAADIHRWVKPDRVIAPNALHRGIYDAMFEQYLKLYTGTRDVMHALKAITKAS
jgi:xylulokinase